MCRKCKETWFKRPYINIGHCRGYTEHHKRTRTYAKFNKFLIVRASSLAEPMEDDDFDTISLRSDTE